MITAGLLLFNFAKMKTKDDKKEEDQLFGLAMIFTSLFFDGLTQT